LTQPPPAPPDKPDQPATEPGGQPQPPDQPTELASQPRPPDQPTGPASQPRPPDQPTGLASQPELPNQPAAALPPPPPVPTAPPKKKRRIWPYVTIGVVLLVILLGVGGVVLLGVLLREEVPEVGQCLDDAPSPDDMEVVDCGSAEAAWSVIGNDGPRTRGEFDQATQGDLCQAFAETQQAMWVTTSYTVDSSTEGEVICLAPVG
jgi:hypothetical protein